MRFSDLQWTTVTDSRSSKFFVKNTELATALVRPRCRYQICEMRTYDPSAEWPYGERYEVRDAHSVSDADIKAGVRPHIVFRASTFDEIVAFCENNV